MKNQKSNKSQFEETNLLISSRLQRFLGCKAKTENIIRLVEQDGAIADSPSVNYNSARYHIGCHFVIPFYFPKYEKYSYMAIKRDDSKNIQYIGLR